MALPPLATREQLAAWMQVDPASLPAGTESVLAAVSAIVRKEARNNFQRATTTLVRRPREGCASLPLRPVIRVENVTRDGKPVAWEWDEEAELLFVNGCTPVSVTFTHGYDRVPDDVLAVVLTAAQHVVTNPQNLRQETVGSISVTYSSETIGASLSPADKDLLARYRRTVAVVRLI